MLRLKGENFSINQKKKKQLKICEYSIKVLIVQRNENITDFYFPIAISKETIS